MPIQHDRKPLAFEAEIGLPLTLGISNFGLAEFVRVAERFGTSEYGYSVTPNVDHLIRYCDDPSCRELYGAARFVLLDSRFLALVLKVVTGASLPTCLGSDLTAALFEKVIAPDDPIVVIGNSARQIDVLRQRHHLKNLHHYNPPMGFINDSLAVEAALKFVEEHSPFRFCFLAVGSPQQEILARALKTRARARGLALCIGASINFLTGGERRAPPWVSRVGLEWLFRLMQNPLRLTGRYLLRGPRIFLLLPRLKFELRTADADLV